jgi:hypothetical protein
VNNYSENVTKTKLYKEIDTLELEFIYETDESAFFGAEKDGKFYWLIESFETGEIMVTSEDAEIFEKSERILNLFRLNI